MTEYEEKTEQDEQSEKKDSVETSDLPFSGERYSFRDLTGKDSPGNLLFSWISLILGALSFILSFFTIWSLLCVALGIGSALFSRKKNGYFDKIAIIGISLGVIAAIFAFFFRFVFQ